jgi:S1-C subfamily serine protease
MMGFVFALALTMGVGTSECALLPQERNNIEVYRKCHVATVNITTTTLRYDFFTQIYPQEGNGSGVVIHPDGYVVTNNHVLGNAVKVAVTLFDKTEYAAKIVGRDPYSDLAVLKIDAGRRKLKVLDFADPDKLAVGQKTLAIGNPFRLGGSLSVGIISALDRVIRSGERGRGRKIKDIIQTDAAINPGNSGGPLLNSSGEIIGINTQIVSPSGGSHGIGFAISVKTVKRVSEQLIKFGQIIRAWAGFEGMGLGKRSLRDFGIPLDHGVLVVEVDPRGPAAKAGLRPTRQQRMLFQQILSGGDVITHVDGKPVAQFLEIEDMVFEKKVGQKIKLRIYREGRKRGLTLRLQPEPKYRGGHL